VHIFKKRCPVSFSNLHVIITGASPVSSEKRSVFTALHLTRGLWQLLAVAKWQLQFFSSYVQVHRRFTQLTLNYIKSYKTSTSIVLCWSTPFVNLCFLRFRFPQWADSKIILIYFNKIILNEYRNTQINEYKNI